MRKFIYLFIPVLLLSCGKHESEVKTCTAIVWDRSYKPNDYESHVSPGFSSDGKVVMSTTSSGSSEAYYIIIKRGNSVYSFESKEAYETLYIGDTVHVQYVDILNSHDEVVAIRLMQVTR